MNEKIFLRIKFTVDDYVRVLIFMRNQLFINKYLFFIFPPVVFLTLVIILYLSASDKSTVNWLEMFFAGFVPAIFVTMIVYLLNKFSSPLTLKRAIKKQYESSPAMQEERSVVISNEGIESSGKLASGTIKWEAIIKGVESETDFIFYTTSKFSNFIPKNAFVSEDDVNFLRCLSRAKLGDKAKF